MIVLGTASAQGFFVSVSGIPGDDRGRARVRSARERKFAVLAIEDRSRSTHLWRLETAVLLPGVKLLGDHRMTVSTVAPGEFEFRKVFAALWKFHHELGTQREDDVVRVFHQ